MKIRILIFITLIVVIFVGYFAYRAVKKSSKLQSPISQNSPTQKISPKKTVNKAKEYIDPAGFKFSYPENLKLEVIDKKDPAYYSSLRFKSPSSEGLLTIEATATKYSSLEDWIKNNKEIIGNSKDIKLADLNAKEISSEGKKIIVAVDLETLFTITATYDAVDQEFWKTATDTIVSSFTFELPQTPLETTDSESTGEDVVFEG